MPRLPSRSWIALLLAALLVGGPASAEPLASLARDLTDGLAERAPSGVSIFVPPVVDRRGDLGGHAERLRKLLLLRLAGLEDVRVLAVDRPPREPDEGSLLLETYLDTQGGALVLSGALEDLGPAPREPVALLAVADAEGGLDTPRPVDRAFRLRIVEAGSVPGPVRATAAGDVTVQGGVELVLVGDDETRVLDLDGYSFRTRWNAEHPRPSDAPAEGEVGTLSRDPRAGAVVLAEGRIWVRPPGARTSAIVGPRVTGGTRVARVDFLPLGRLGAGRILVGQLEEGTNRFARIGIVRGPDDREPGFLDQLSPALEAVTGSGWLALSGRDGSVDVHESRDGLERLGTLGVFGSALAILDLGLGSRPLLVGDRPEPGVLSAVALSSGFGDELWQGVPPFAPCLLEAGDFDGDGGPELVLVGCGDPARLALLVPEGRP